MADLLDIGSSTGELTWPRHFKSHLENKIT